MTEVENVIPSIFSQLLSVFSNKKSHIESLKDARDKKDNGIQMASVCDSPGEVLMNIPDVEDIIKNCVTFSRQCRKRAKLYRSLNIFVIFFSSFVSPSAGIVGSQFGFTYGYVTAGVAGVLTVILNMFLWGQLSETYSGYCLEFQRAALSDDPVRDYNIVVVKIKSSSLNFDLWEDPEVK